MNIKIRDIDKNVVAKLDDMARKNHLSRNKFLIKILEKNSIIPEMELLLENFKRNQEEIIKLLKVSLELNIENIEEEENE